VDVAVDTARGEDLPVAGQDFRRRPDDQGRIDAVHRVGVARFADADDPAVADADVGLDHAPVVQNDRAGDDQVGRAFGTGHHALAHRLTDHLAAAEDHFVTAAGTHRTVLGDLDQQIGVGQPDPVTGGRAEQPGVPR